VVIELSLRFGGIIHLSIDIAYQFGHRHLYRQIPLLAHYMCVTRVKFHYLQIPPPLLLLLPNFTTYKFHYLRISHCAGNYTLPSNSNTCKDD